VSQQPPEPEADNVRWLAMLLRRIMLSFIAEVERRYGIR